MQRWVKQLTYNFIRLLASFMLGRVTRPIRSLVCYHFSRSLSLSMSLPLPKLFLLAACLLSVLTVSAQSGNDGPLPPSPSPGELTVDNNIEYAQLMLANSRPYVPGGDGGPDGNYRRLRYEYKVPVEFTWDRPYVELITRQNNYLYASIENISEGLRIYSDPENPYMRYSRAKILKIKRVHLTTTPKPAGEQYAEPAGYLMNWDPATGVLTMAASTAKGNRSSVSAVNYEYIRDFVKEVMK